MRNVLVHYHLFKNAGSSIDSTLDKSFGNKWHAFDPEGKSTRLSSRELERVINDHPDCVAFSSHCIVPPVLFDDLCVHPIVVLRDPIARVMSAYLFEWQKQKGVKEPIGSLAEYICKKFSSPRANAIEDFQTIRLSVADPDATSPDLDLPDELILNQAIEFIDSLPVFGIVEKFNDSLRMLQRTYGAIFPELKFENVTVNVLQSTSTPMHARYKKIENLIGAELFGELISRNQMDLKLYFYAMGKFDSMLAQFNAHKLTELNLEDNGLAVDDVLRNSA